MGVPSEEIMEAEDHRVVFFLFILLRQFVYNIGRSGK
jgi:hypothetical protein